MRDVLVDLKRRIQGDFYIIEEDEEKIVLGNRACPFAEKVIDRPAMCMMTSNVFGVIAAQNLGYSKVVLNETIATGSEKCRVTVYIKPTEDAQKHGPRVFQGIGFMKAYETVANCFPTPFCSFPLTVLLSPSTGVCIPGSGFLRIRSWEKVPPVSFTMRRRTSRSIL